nr:MAG TPA: hypothetical protein [Caudoviricetes sp.]
MIQAFSARCSFPVDSSGGEFLLKFRRVILQ